jgi:hypothetical protein
VKMGRRWLIVGAVSMLIVGLYAGTAVGAGVIALIVNGKPSSAEVLVHNGATYVPLRAAAELLGSEVQWDSSSRTVRIESLAEQGVKFAGDFRFSGITVKEQNGITMITTEIRNESDNRAEAVLFSAVFYDAEGKRLGNAVGTAVDLSSGETATVHMLTDDNGSLSDYATVRYQVEQVL